MRLLGPVPPSHVPAHPTRETYRCNCFEGNSWTHGRTNRLVSHSRRSHPFFLLLKALAFHGYHTTLAVPAYVHFRGLTQRPRCGSISSSRAYDRFLEHRIARILMKRVTHPSSLSLLYVLRSGEGSRLTSPGCTRQMAFPTVPIASVVPDLSHETLRGCPIPTPRLETLTVR